MTKGKTGKAGKAGKTGKTVSAGTSRAPRPPKNADLPAIVRGLVKQFAETSAKEAKISVADFLRLLGLLKELEEEKGIDEIRIQWVEADKIER